MSTIGTNVAQSIAGAGQAERIEAGERKKAERADPRQARLRKDQHDTVTVEAETLEAVRHLAGNDQEQAREDRQEHPSYTPSGAARAVGRPKLDIEG
ncbi:MAG: hypothetical protein IT437_01015 [Phycisphaerales bacterium]|nr:hypothetical protein [Phycisphaerales bacterium]